MIRMRHVSLALLATSLSLPAMAGTPSVSAGASYFSGKYGSATTTTIWSVPLVFGYDTGSWHFKVTLPYISVTGVGDVLPGVGKVQNSNPIGLGSGRGNAPGGGGTTTTTTGTTTASGMGDVTAQAGYTLFYDQDARMGMDLGAKVKFGTADANKGLGTGQNDYGLNLDTYKGIGKWTFFGGVGYTHYGSSQYIKLSNGSNANAGFSYKVADNDNLGAFYYYRQRISSYGYRQSEVTGFWNHKFSDTMRLQAYVLAGLSNGSPDFGGGASLKMSF